MTFAFTRFWIALWTLLAALGWVLSAIHHLDGVGYTVALMPGLTLLCVKLGLPWKRGHPWRRRRRRFYPAAFLLLLAAVILSGCLYAPNNYDALAYRVPRLLHWLAADQWHWIHTGFNRINTRAADCEWAMVPFVLLFRSERLVWILNAACLAAMPGLIYSLLVAVGVAPRAAYRWMWLLPSASVFIVEAGGDANDLPGAFFVLAAHALALRAKRRASAPDLLYSLLAIALASGVKVSNAPLALPWLVAAWPSRRLLFARPFRTAAVGLLAALVSFLPTAALNSHFAGDWSGASLELDPAIEHAPAWVHATGNLINLSTQNLTPSVFPLAGRWNAIMTAHMPSRLVSGMEGGDHLGGVSEMQTEDSAGLGPLLWLLLGAAALARLRDRSPAPCDRWTTLLRWSPWISLAVFFSKMSLLEAGRLAAPYYILLALPLLAGARAAAGTRAKWWHAVAALQFASALLTLIIAPNRPLWPALTVLDRLPNSPTVTRARQVYSVYRNRADALAQVRALLPPEVKSAGLVVNNDLEASLWRPFGERRFEHLMPSEPGHGQMRWIVVSRRAFERETSEPFETWLKRLSPSEIRTVYVTSLASEPPVPWYVLKVE